LVSKVEQFKLISDSIGLAPGVIYPENPTPGNIAFKKIVSAESISKNSDLLPQRINDGNRNTQWQSDIRDTSWIFVDLEDTFKLNKLRLIWFHTPPKEFLVQISDDSLNWHIIRSYKDEATRIMDISELDVVGRYIRLYLTRYSDSAFYSLWEIEAYGIKYSDFEAKKDVIFRNVMVFPNPFTNSVNIEFYLNANSILSVKIFDFKGSEVESIFEGYLLKGWHNLYWNGARYSNGEYNIIMSTGNYSINLKTILMK
jgi:hypothetical protein